MKLVFEFKTNSLPLDLNNLFQENKEINCHFTRNVGKAYIFHKFELNLMEANH